MQYDVYFFLKGLPVDRLISGGHYFVAKIHGNGEQVLEILETHSQAFKAFTKRNDDTPIFIFGFRVECDDAKSAMRAAHLQVSGLVDGYCLICDSPPEYSDLVLVSENQSNEARAYIYKQGGWTTVQDQGFDKAGQWQARNELLFTKILQYFDVVAEVESTPETELRTNLLYAMRMYRHGAESVVAGIGFLSKFSALECLICGDARNNKEDLIKFRLQALFDDAGEVDDVRIQRLWLLRCSASHQARVYDDIEESEHLPPAVGSLFLDQLFAGVVFFTLDNAYKTATIDKLWEKADAYTLPDLITNHLPEGLMRMGLSEFTLKHNFGVTGLAVLLDDFIARNPHAFKTAKVIS
ncbi:hypothetical protein JO972_04010 [Verrucomicrobiaceae bacterium 5K15]|uniref:Uncharacterized protein n=1 Tax=Oceaniferula flava TaxID=2800421 RepID=A0AAE2S9W9_9BACT|nr:hypothetical protein [Oceaniferula flavus]MBK1854105.1 hypothetical protein [Oceaniferula flavus]MBM1135411.1 hypothetical protein [Oceaniferula flavus]